MKNDIISNTDAIPLINKLGEIAVSLSAVASISDLAQKVEVVLEDLTDIEYSAIYFYSPEDKRLILYCAKGFTEEERSVAEKTAMERHPGKVFNEGVELFLPDVDSAPELTITSKRSFSVKSRLFIPVKVNNNTVGVFGIVSSKQNSLGEYHRTVLNFVGKLAGNAYQRINSSKIIEQNLSRLSSLISNIQEGVIVEDDERKILLVNQEFCNIFSIPAPPSMLKGADCSNSAEESKHLFNNPDDFIRRINEILNKKALVKGDILHLTDGRILERDYVPIFVENIYSGHFWKYNDITEVKRKEVEIINKTIKLSRFFEQQKLIADISQKLSIYDNDSSVLQEIIDLLGNYTQVSRVYIFVDGNNGATTSNVFEWCNDNITPQISDLQETNYEIIPSWKKILNSEGKIFSSNIAELSDDIRNLLEPQGIKSILVFPLIVQNGFFGFIGFDECAYNRTWGIEEIEMLRTVSSNISNWYERQSIRRSLIESQAQLQLAIECTNAGLWDWNMVTGEVFFSDIWLSMLGYSKGDIEPHVNSWSLLIHPEDKDEVFKKLNAHLEGLESAYVCEHRLLTKDRQWKWILDSGKVVERDEQNNPIRAIGTHIDISVIKSIEEELSNSKRELSGIINTSVDAIVTINTAGIIQTFNKRAENLFMYSAEEAIGKNISSFMPLPYSKLHDRYLQEYLETGAKRIIGTVREVLVKRKDRTVIPVEISISEFEVTHGRMFTGILRDITERKEIENKLRDYQTNLQEKSASLQAIFSTAADAIIIADSDGIIQSVNLKAEEIFDSSAQDVIGRDIYEFLNKKESSKILNYIKRNSIRNSRSRFSESIEITARRLDGAEFPAELSVSVFSTSSGKKFTAILRDITARKAAEESLRKLLEDFEWKNFELESAKSKLEQSLDDIEWKNLELDLKNIELEKSYKIIETDLKAAAKVQKELLPSQSVVLQGFQCKWLFMPSVFLSGDIFNYFPIDNEHIGFYLLDVAGHGIPSAMLSVTLSRIVSPDSGSDNILSEIIDGELKVKQPSKVIAYLNERFQSQVDSMSYFTMIYGIVNTNENKLTLCQAGHPSPILIKSDGKIVIAGSSGVPVGMLPNMDYEDQTFDFFSGDRLIIFSDGVTECTNFENIMFSEKRLIDYFEENHLLENESIISLLEKELKFWRGKDEFEDDVTLLLIGRE